MLQVEYIKDLQCSYMLIKDDTNNENGYKCRMLHNNRLKYLLTMEIRNFDKEQIYYYDISNKCSIEDYFTHNMLGFAQIKSIIQAIIYGIQEGFEYLLYENDFILDPSYIYIEESSNHIYLCYYSAYNKDIRQQLVELIEYLMNKVDYTDNQAVLLVYGLYRVSREDNCSYDKLIEQIELTNSKDSNSKSSREIVLNNDVELIPLDIRKEQLQEIESMSEDNRIWEENFTNESNLEDEKEVYAYSKITYILAVLSSIALVIVEVLLYKSGILLNTFSSAVDIKKFIISLIIIVLVEGFILSRLFCDRNKEAIIISKKNTSISNKKGKHHVELEKDEISRKDFTKIDKEEMTELLSIKQVIYLKAMEENQYKCILISSFPFLIGKNKGEVNYPLNYSVISREHCCINNIMEEFTISDLDSSNGTYVNDRKLTPHKDYVIRHGDTISLANIKYKLVIQEK